MDTIATQAKTFKECKIVNVTRNCSVYWPYPDFPETFEFTGELATLGACNGDVIEWQEVEYELVPTGYHLVPGARKAEQRYSRTEIGRRAIESHMIGYRSGGGYYWKQ